MRSWANLHTHTHIFPRAIPPRCRIFWIADAFVEIRVRARGEISRISLSPGVDPPSVERYQGIQATRQLKSSLWRAYLTITWKFIRDVRFVESGSRYKPSPHRGSSSITVVMSRMLMLSIFCSTDILGVELLILFRRDLNQRFCECSLKLPKSVKAYE